MVQAIDDPKEFEDVVENGDKLTVVDFWAEWCGPCKIYKPKFEDTESEFPDALFVTVNVDKNHKIADKYEVSSIPATLIFNRGEMRGGFRGNVSKDDLIKAIKEAI